MAFLTVNNVAIRGIAACVPPRVEENKGLPFYAEGEADKVIAGTGIERRHICTDGITTSDLCWQAAEKLLAELGWEKDSIDVLGYVTQTPDYINHPTSFVVHERLGLPDSCMCVDFFHGCPGWVVGLSGLAHYLQGGGETRLVA